jgi:hypothetical protein
MPTSAEHQPEAQRARRGVLNKRFAARTARSWDPEFPERRTAKVLGCLLGYERVVADRALRTGAPSAERHPHGRDEGDQDHHERPHER